MADKLKFDNHNNHLFLSRFAQYNTSNMQLFHFSIILATLQEILFLKKSGIVIHNKLQSLDDSRSEIER
jgi:hypothetical protein